MEKLISRRAFNRAFNRVFLKVLACFYLFLGIIMVIMPDLFLVYWEKDTFDFPYTMWLYLGGTNIALSLFIFEVVRINADLLRPIIFLIILGVIAVYSMFTMRAEIVLTLPVYTWRLASLALLFLALFNELYLRKK